MRILCFVLFQSIIVFVTIFESRQDDFELFKLIKLGSQSSHYFTFSYALYEVRSSEARSLGQEQVPQRVRQEGQVREGRRDDAER